MDIKTTHKLISVLYKDGFLSLTHLSKKMDRSLSLITKKIFELVDDGIVEEAGIAESSGGRKPILYKLKDDNAYNIVMAMDQYISRILIMDMGNNIIDSPISVNIDLAKEKDVAGCLIDLIRTTISRSNIPKEKILGIGIAMPGFVDFVKGVNYSFIPSPISGISIRDYISKALDLPVFIDNDSSTVALAESTFGFAKHVANAMVVNISWGIGLGIISNGQIYRGENGFAGEFSHIPLFNNGKICSCGKIGCLETETSLKIILGKVKAALEEGRPSVLKKAFVEDSSLEEQFLVFIQAVEQRDMLAIELLNEAAYNLGRGISVLIHIFNPKKIILSGRGAMAGDVWLPAIQQAVNEHCIRRLAENIEIVVSPMAHRAELIGTAALVVESIYNQ